MLGYELAKAREIINEFIHSCSHSMRGPLKSITGLVNLLQRDPANDHNIEYVERILQSVREMESRLNHLEQSLENSRKNFIIESVDMHAFVHTVIDEVKKETGFTDIVLNIHVEQSESFYTDINCFKIFVKNLILNAVNFSDESKTEKFVDILVNASGRSCSIHVNDNGIGISPEEQDKIFQLFYRGTAKAAGSGVGLYVVHEIVKKLGGSISVNSAVGAGANFFVWIPNLAA